MTKGRQPGSLAQKTLKKLEELGLTAEQYLADRTIIKKTEKMLNKKIVDIVGTPISIKSNTSVETILETAADILVKIVGDAEFKIGDPYATVKSELLIEGKDFLVDNHFLPEDSSSTVNV